MTGVAERYASALYELAKDQGAAPQVEQDLMKFQALLDGSDDLRHLVSSRFGIFSRRSNERSRP